MKKSPTKLHLIRPVDPSVARPVIRYRVKMPAKLITQVIAFKTAHGFSTPDDALNFLLNRGLKAMGINE